MPLKPRCQPTISGFRPRTPRLRRLTAGWWQWTVRRHRMTLVDVGRNCGFSGARDKVLRAVKKSSHKSKIPCWHFEAEGTIYANNEGGAPLATKSFALVTSEKAHYGAFLEKAVWPVCDFGRGCGKQPDTAFAGICSLTSEYEERETWAAEFCLNTGLLFLQYRLFERDFGGHVSREMLHTDAQASGCVISSSKQSRKRRV